LASIGAPPGERGPTLDQRLSYSLFSHDAPQVDVYGNLVQATEGKSESEVPIGDGDSRAVFQTFEIPKAPLTYLLDPAAPAPTERARTTRFKTR